MSRKLTRDQLVACAAEALEIASDAANLAHQRQHGNPLGHIADRAAVWPLTAEIFKRLVAQQYPDPPER